MRTTIGLFLLGLAAGPLLADEAPNTMVLEPNLVSKSCESLFKTLVDAKGTQLQFSPKILSLDGKKTRDALSCKIAWKPSIPENKRLVSAELMVEGKMSGPANGIVRLGHKILGTGDAPDLLSHTLENGTFNYKLQIQNIDSDNCGREVKLITTFSFILTQKKVVEGEPSDPVPASLTLDTVRLLPLELTDCPQGVRSGNEGPQPPTL